MYIESVQLGKTPIDSVQLGKTPIESNDKQQPPFCVQLLIVRACQSCVVGNKILLVLF
jgi:hypothetical protein